MRMMTGLILAGWTLSVGGLSAESTVKLSGVHLCCRACVTGVEKAGADVTGLTIDIDQKGGSVTLKAAASDTVKQGVAALAKAGFHGLADKSEFAMPNDSGAKAGKVKSLEVTGIHNCCQRCTNDIAKCCKSLDGVKEVKIENKSSNFVVEGDFDAKALVDQLNAAGFHVQVK